MIPKILHYCWFGKGKKSDIFYRCLESWKKYCPDYDIIEWNEENFDINSNWFVKEAYEHKKWAFVSDYVRLFVLYNMGGIYVDTDLEITRNIDKFLVYRAITGFESEKFIPTAFMGSEAKTRWIELLLNYYKDRHFLLSDGTLDMLANPHIITKITQQYYPLQLNGKKQCLNNEIMIYPHYTFCNNIRVSENYSIHHFEGSWVNVDYKERSIRFEKNYTLLINMHKIIEGKDKINNKISGLIYLFGKGELYPYVKKVLEINSMHVKGVIVRKNTDMEEDEIAFDEIDGFGVEDTIVVIPTYNFNEICKEIKDKTCADIVSLEYFIG